MDKRLKRKEHTVSECSALLVRLVTSQCVAYFHHLDQFPVAINTANDPALVAKNPIVGQGKTPHLFGCVLCWFFKTF